MNDKIYLPQCYARALETQYGEVLSLSFASAEALINFVKANTNQRGGINFTIARRREPSKGITHSVYLDTYEPDVKRATHQMRAAANAVANMPTTQDQDVPF